MVAITTSLDKKYVDFLRDTAKKQWLRQNEIIEASLELYKKKMLEQEIAEWFLSRQEEYRDIASDFVDVQFNSLKE